MGSEGCVLVEGCSVNDHRNFEIKLFQNPNGLSLSPSPCLPLVLVLTLSRRL
jgi:hypothetical protein